VVVSAEEPNLIIAPQQSPLRPWSLVGRGKAVAPEAGAAGCPLDCDRADATALWLTARPTQFRQDCGNALAPNDPS